MAEVNKEIFPDVEITGGGIQFSNYLNEYTLNEELESSICYSTAQGVYAGTDHYLTQSWQTLPPDRGSGTRTQFGIYRPFYTLSQRSVILMQID